MRETKDSGVEWIGEIPKVWKVQRVKHAFYRKNEKAMVDNPVVLSLARSGVKVRDITNNEGQIAESYFNYNPVDIDDLLINPMDLYSGANCSLSKVKGVISPAYVNLRYKKGVLPAYFDYYFKLQYWLMAFFAYGKGVSYDNRWTLSAETLMNYPIVVPSYDTQQRIASYLDSKCSKIDAIIEKQQTVIEKLKEYKLSLITETVTKGLNPDVPMKDSGVEWIGDIPEHWIQTKFKYLCIEIGDGIHTTPEYDPSGEYYFLNGNNIGSDNLVFKESTQRLNHKEYIKYKRPKLNCNTIMITLNGATYGKTSFYNMEKVLLGKSAGYLTLHDSVDKKFVRYFLQSDVAKKQIDISLCGSTIANVSLRTLNELWIPLPLYKEQKDIADFLDRKCSAIDATISKKQALIEKLTAYKKSLIYEVVTGKKEV